MLRNVEFVIEAITEKESDQKNLLQRLNAVVGTNSVVASNTSTISISRLAESIIMTSPSLSKKKWLQMRAVRAGL